MKAIFREERCDWCKVSKNLFLVKFTGTGFVCRACEFGKTIRLPKVEIANGIPKVIWNMDSQRAVAPSRLSRFG
jgi:hypothetical protein